MKNIVSVGLLFVILIAACKPMPDNAVNAAAIHYSGVFITNNIPSIPSLRIKGVPDVTSDSANIYHISGMVEGYSSYNTPVSVEHFSETLHYSGGDPNDSTSWSCIEIYVGKKKMK